MWMIKAKVHVSEWFSLITTQKTSCLMWPSWLPRRSAHFLLISLILYQRFSRSVKIARICFWEKQALALRTPATSDAHIWLLICRPFHLLCTSAKHEQHQLRRASIVGNTVTSLRSSNATQYLIPIKSVGCIFPCGFFWLSALLAYVNCTFEVK